MIYEFIIIVGAELWRTYGKQFLKVLKLLQGQYMVQLNEVDTSGGKIYLVFYMWKSTAYYRASLT